MNNFLRILVLMFACVVFCSAHCESYQDDPNDYVIITCDRTDNGYIENITIRSHQVSDGEVVVSGSAYHVETCQPQKSRIIGQ